MSSRGSEAGPAPSPRRPRNDSRVTHPQAWITLWTTRGETGEPSGAQRQRVAITKPDSTIAKPITRLMYSCECSGIGYCEFDT
jgi:hypothetical protein